MSMMIPYTSIGNMSRRPLWNSLSISSLITYTCDEAYEQKSSVELQVHFSADSINFLLRNTRNKSFVQLLGHGLAIAIHL